MERTLMIIKPDAVKGRHIGHIVSFLEKENFNLLGLRMVQLSTAQAQDFYAVHKERPFYNDLVSYMTSGKVVVIALEGENAVARMRAIIGATNPKDAAEGTIRKLYAESIEANAVHGSDSAENGLVETSFYFATSEMNALR
ncbi:MAG: nucleoside-diphosphate kinase [Calditrichaeota bacterium]|nr:nucleoside-diphosphate kinase [Calditrichota bacterium]MCB9473227.1 nucleoside-diphosphate kinase [Candidatus Delongbacteria bacterium]